MKVVFNLFYKVCFKIEKILAQEKIRRLKASMKYCGEEVKIHNACHILVPQNFEIGNNSSVSSYTTIFATFGVTIGKNCWISSNVGISSYNHIQNSDNRHRDLAMDKEFSKPVIIGDNVWIGMNVCILPGVKIGNNSIIGAGSVVTKDVGMNEIWVGNPAKFVKKIEL